jgi:uncharacterized protein
LRQALSLESFGGGGFRVAGVWRPGSLLILEDQPLAWRPTSLAEVTVDDLQAVLVAPPGVVEFVLLGAGEAQALPARGLRDALRGAGLGLEFMATEAATRLHNVLASEGRLFATALIAV